MSAVDMGSSISLTRVQEDRPGASRNFQDVRMWMSVGNLLFFGNRRRRGDANFCGMIRWRSRTLKSATPQPMITQLLKINCIYASQPIFNIKYPKDPTNRTGPDFLNQTLYPIHRTPGIKSSHPSIVGATNSRSRRHCVSHCDGLPTAQCGDQQSQGVATAFIESYHDTPIMFLTLLFPRSCSQGQLDCCPDAWSHGPAQAPCAVLHPAGEPTNEV